MTSSSLLHGWGGPERCLLTSHVMTNSERLPPPPLTLAGVTFGAGGRRQISLVLLTSHDGDKEHVIHFPCCYSHMAEGGNFLTDLNFNIQKSCTISANFSQLSCVCRCGQPVMWFYTRWYIKDLTLVSPTLFWVLFFRISVSCGTAIVGLLKANLFGKSATCFLDEKLNATLISVR